jgi:hypothetical protein
MALSPLVRSSAEPTLWSVRELVNGIRVLVVKRGAWTIGDRLLTAHGREFQVCATVPEN